MNSIRVASLKDNISRKVSLTTKIFVWSILFEPLIFFHIVPQNISGVGGSISRILQFIVLSIFIFRFLISGKARIYNPFSLLNRGFSYFYILAISAGILGYFFGSYSANLSVEFLDKNTLLNTSRVKISLSIGKLLNKCKFQKTINSGMKLNLHLLRLEMKNRHS